MGREFIVNDYVGLAAGTVWHCLGQYGPLNYPDEIMLITGLTEEYVRMAYGWLSREGKVRMFENTQTGARSVCLTDAEMKIYSERQNNPSS